MIYSLPKDVYWGNDFRYMKSAMQLIFHFLAAPMDFMKLFKDNVNSCNAVVRANACAVQEIVLNKTCELPPNSRK